MTDWNPGAGGGVSALALSSDHLYVGGGFTTLGGEGRAYLGSFNLSDGTLTSWNPRASSTVRALLHHGSLVYVGGDGRFGMDDHGPIGGGIGHFIGE